MSRIRRFLHLERARPAPIEPDVGPSSRRRFGGVDAADEGERSPPEAPAPPPGAAATPGDGAGAPTRSAADRFREPPARGPDVAAKVPGAQPFVRCCRCETDNSVYAEHCTTCGAELDTPEQRRFNEALWAERQEEAQRLEEEVRRLREASEKAAEEARRARQEMGELIAREVARREQERLDPYGGFRRRYPGGWGMGELEEVPGRPLGIQLLFLIRSPGWRLVAIAAVLVALVGMVVAALTSAMPPAFLPIPFVLFAILFAPLYRRRR